MASQMSSQVQEASSRDKDLFILRSRQPAVTKNVILMVVNSRTKNFVRTHLVASKCLR
jgi:hypothetical protein